VINNAFLRHDIDHLSYSSVATFAAEPALWVMERLLKMTGPVGAAAHRGTAAEAGIVAGLLNPSMPIEDCQAAADFTFLNLTALSRDARVEKERAAVPGIVRVGIERLRPRGVPSATQKRIEVMLPGVPVPWVGWIDLLYEEHQVVVDIKSTLRLPFEPSSSHCRQVSLYTYATPHLAKVGYFTPSKSEIYPVDNRELRIAELINIAQRMQRFLEMSDDPKVLAGIVVPNVDSFYWSDETTRAMCRKVYGL
jgi:hypothetical protein